VESIHQRKDEIDEDRADFLWDMFKEHGGHIKDHAFYLDVGTGRGENPNVLKHITNCDFSVGIDIKLRNLIMNSTLKPENQMLLLADAQKLPFRDNVFDLISMFSVIEHVPNAQACLSEAFRSLKGEGQLFMQFPNRYFPVELHSALPFYFYIPKRLRYWLATKLGEPWEMMKEVDIPSPRTLRKQVRRIEASLSPLIVGFHYPESFLPKSKWLRFFHRLMDQLHIFRIIPMGYIAFLTRSSE
jgi:ubiquinone/menaquinone biosynthesis C-methylase UbiE